MAKAGKDGGLESVSRAGKATFDGFFGGAERRGELSDRFSGKVFALEQLALLRW